MRTVILPLIRSAEMTHAPVAAGRNTKSAAGSNVQLKKEYKWCFTIGIYNSKKIGIVGLYIGYAVLLSVLGISIAPMQL